MDSTLGCLKSASLIPALLLIPLGLAAQYRPQLLTRIGYVDLKALTASVQRDIILAKEMKTQ